MNISTKWSTNPDLSIAIRDTFGELTQELNCSPELLIVYVSAEYTASNVIVEFEKLAFFGALHGSTTCLGVMTEQGFHSSNGVGMGMLGISDPKGNYGTHLEVIQGNGRITGQKAIINAIKNSGRVGEPPELVWINCAPGKEEAILLGIQDEIGLNVPIAGGSSADNNVEGKWYQFSNNVFSTDAVMITAMYPSTRPSLAFHSGYTPTGIKGIVTKAEHRTIYEINNIPAAKMYNSWTNGLVKENLDGGNVLMDTTLSPIGRVVGIQGELPYYQLSHPESILPNGAIRLFSEIQSGQEIILMEGSKNSLVTRAGRVAKAAKENVILDDNSISGALVVYCAGCMLTVLDDMNQVASEINNVLEGNPFLGVFTFGEQGCFIKGENRHGNLMISVVVFN